MYSDLADSSLIPVLSIHLGGLAGKSMLPEILHHYVKAHARIQDYVG